MRYVAFGRSGVLLADFLSCLPSHQCPPFSEVQELANKSRLHTIDPGIVLLFRHAYPPLSSDAQRSVGRTASLLNHEPIRVYVRLLMRPWVMQTCHSPASRHLRTARTLHMLERVSWWIGSSICTWGW